MINFPVETRLYHPGAHTWVAHRYGREGADGRVVVDYGTCSPFPLPSEHARRIIGDELSRGWGIYTVDNCGRPLT